MPLPKECKMPDLSHLLKEKALKLFLLPVIIGSDNDLDPNFASYRKVFIRLADKAVYEYSIVRVAMINQIKIHEKVGSMSFASIINHLENCVNPLENCIATLRRLLYLFDRIKKKIFIDKNLRKLVESRHSKPIINIRDKIEHIDGDISKGKFSKGEMLVLDISEDASEIIMGGIKITTQELANLIKYFHAIALELAIYNAPGVNEKTFKIIKQKKAH